MGFSFSYPLYISYKIEELVQRITLKVNPKGAWESSPLEKMVPFLEGANGDTIESLVEN